MSEIGGFLDLSANWQLKGISHNPILLNTARNCIRYIAQQRKIRRVLVPYYTCHTVVRALKNDGIKIVFYFLDEDFMPVLPHGSEDEYVIYVNYYGVMDELVAKVVKKYTKLIIDNSQAFFSTPHKEVDSVSSPRKFFGLPDGGLLYPGRDLILRELSADKSSERMLPLFKRLDCGAKEAFADSLAARKSLVDAPIKRMSYLTQLLLGSLDFKFCRERRRKNWRVVDEVLGKNNRLKIKLTEQAVPLFYPYFSHDKELRSFLISKNVFVGTYWPDVQDFVPSNSFEADLVTKMVPLPIDQRYNEEHMLELLRIISEK
jgi:hypothetical protein